MRWTLSNHRQNLRKFATDYSMKRDQGTKQSRNIRRQQTHIELRVGSQFWKSWIQFSILRLLGYCSKDSSPEWSMMICVFDCFALFQKQSLNTQKPRYSATGPGSKYKVFILNIYITLFPSTDIWQVPEIPILSLGHWIMLTTCIW